MVYKISYEKLSDFFNITDNQKRFAKEFIKYLELKYLLTARDFDITSKKSSSSPDFKKLTNFFNSDFAPCRVISK